MVDAAWHFSFLLCIGCSLPPQAHGSQLKTSQRTRDHQPACVGAASVRPAEPAKARASSCWILVSSSSLSVGCFCRSSTCPLLTASDLLWLQEAIDVSFPLSALHNRQLSTSTCRLLTSAESAQLVDRSCEAQLIQSQPLPFLPAHCPSCSDCASQAEEWANASRRSQASPLCSLVHSTLVNLSHS